MCQHPIDKWYQYTCTYMTESCNIFCADILTTQWNPSGIYPEFIGIIIIMKIKSVHKIEGHLKGAVPLYPNAYKKLLNISRKIIEAERLSQNVLH